MNKMKKLLSVVLAVVLALSAFSIMGSAAKTAYKTVDELTALDAYSPYGQVTRLSVEERTSIVFDALDGLLAPMSFLNMGTQFSLLGLEVRINFTSVDGVCDSLDSIADTFSNWLASLAMGIVNLGIAESLEVGTWQTGMTRDGTAQFTILSELLELLSANTTLVGKAFTDGLDLGMIYIGDMSEIEEVLFDLPSMVKSMVFPMLERWDDTLTEIKTLDTNGKGNGNVESTVNTFVKNLFNNDMSITTVKYDVNGNMTSEHTKMPIMTSAPGTPTADSMRCVYVVNGTTPGSVMTVYHIVDEAEAKALAKTPDEINGSPAAYTYFKEAQQYVMAEEVEGSGTYVWKATDEYGNTWSMKWYNDDSQWLAHQNLTGDDIDLVNMSLADLLYTFVPSVFEAMAPVVLNGSIKKVLAEFLGAKFTYVGQGGPEADDAVLALADSSNAFFTQEQGDYLWEWSDYAVINGTHYYRFEDQIFAGDISNKNNYFDIINWDYEITGDFMNEFVPEDGGSPTDTLLMNFNNFLVKVAEEALLPSASTVDTISGFEAEWVRPALTKGDNSNLVKTLKAIAQAVIGLAPQHVFGDDYATNERCYVELMLAEDNDTVLAGIAAHLVNMIMPSMSLPGKSDLLSSNAKVGAILAAVVREFAAYLAPEYNFDALIYADFGTTKTDNVKSFVDPVAAGLVSEGQTASGYWFDVILTMGINVGYEYLRAFADMGEGTAQWNSFVAYSGYGVDGKTYAAGTTQAALNAEWEGMLDYIIDWALEADVEWAWAMENLVDVNGEVNLATAQDPWLKLDSILDNLLPVNEILNVTATDCETELEQLLRYNFILAIVDLRWDDLADTLIVPNGFVRNANVLDQLAAKLKNIVNYLFKKVGNTNNDFALIPDVITDFDSLANQANLVVMVKNLVGALYNAGVTDGGCRTLLPFLNFILGWKTDPQVIAEPNVYTSFRDGNDYAFQWTGNGTYPQINDGSTKIMIMNTSSGMLETHRNSSVTDHAYDINIRSVTSDATVNTLTFSYDSVVSPYETVAITVGGTYNGEEAVTVTIEYDYIGKDGQPVGGTQYTSVSFLVSNQYEDANISGRQSGDDDKDYTGTADFKSYVFTEDIYKTVTEYTASIYFVKATVNLVSSKSFESCQPEGYTKDCNGNVTAQGDVPTGTAANYFAQYEGQAGGWESKLYADSDPSSTTAKLYYAKSGVTADTAFPYGAYDMGGIGVKYGSDTKVYYIDFIYYNDYDIDVLYNENKNNAYTAHDVADADVWNEYVDAWNDIVYLATYPMMTSSRNANAASAGTASTDYVANIMPKIEPAMERFEAAKEAFEKAKTEYEASGSAAGIPKYVQDLEDQLALDDGDGEKEINFQDYDFYEYFNYADLRTAHRNFVKTYYAPEIMDTYYIQGSGIREAELNDVVDAEANPYIAAGILASRMENDAKAIADSITANADWQMPVDSALLVEDMASRLAYYRQFVNDSVKEDPDHLYFLEQEIAHVEAQGLDPANYTEASWNNYAEALEIAKAVAAGNDEYATFNSRIYDVKYNLMVAYKNLLEKDASLIEAGGIADLLVNIETAEEIFASLEAEDGVWALAADYEGEADDAYAALISALGYYYVGEDGNTWNLYEDSAYEYRDNDRPNNQNNQAKVNASNYALERAIANFETSEVERDPNTLVLNENAPFEAYIDLDNNIGGEYTGTIYGFDTLGWNDNFEVDGTIADFVTTAYGDDYLEVIPADGGETTGTVINVLDEEGNVVESYMYIYYGDVDMDGMVGASDAFTCENYEIMYEGFDTLYQFMAGDLDGDAMPGSSDAYIMENYEIMYEGMPFQADVASNVYGCIVYEIF